jgi:hypothetical protein
MLVATKQYRDGIYIGNVGGDDQRRHRQPGFALQPGLPKQRANQTMCKIIHHAVLAN